MGLALGWALLTWLPASNLLLPLTPHYVAERYLYGPSFGVCLLVGWAAARGLTAREPARGPAKEGGKEGAKEGAKERASAPGRPAKGWRPTAGVLVVLLLLAAAWRTAVRVEDWASSERLWSASLAAGQDTWRVRTNLGLALQQAGRPSPAVEHYRRALADRPLPLAARKTLVRNLALAGAPSAAADECRRLLARHPDDFDCHFIVAESARQRGRRDVALRHYRRALELRPGDRPIQQSIEALEEPRTATRRGRGGGP